MTAPTRRRLLGWAALIPILSGCASDEPDYYRLAAVPGNPLAASPIRLELRQVGMARYLDRREIVRAGPSLRINVQESERWAEPLVGMVTRVLAENLAQRLPAATVFPEGSATARGPDTTAEADITRFEDDGAGRVVLEGHFQVRRLGGRSREVSRTVALAVPLRDAGAQALAYGMSVVLSLLADRMAEAAAELIRP
jgi:uncharacterized lipoprotein YmbA